MRASAVLRVLPSVLLASLAVPALAATAPSGTAVAVIQATNVTGTGGSRTLQTEAPVFMGDRVNTGAFGEAQLEFRDETKLVVGPSSSLLIDKFVFSDEKTAKSVTINAVRGTFRFITGSSPKNAYVIRTPTATIGLRGTRFDFSIGTHGETRLALYEGGLRFCDRDGNCVDLTGRCDIVSAAPNRPIERVNEFQKQTVLKTSFPYYNKQEGLRGDFRIDRGSCSVVQSPQSASITLPPPPPVEKPECERDHYGKHHHHGGKDRDGRFGRDGKDFHGDRGRVDDSGLRPAHFNAKGDARGNGKGHGKGDGNALGAKGDGAAGKGGNYGEGKGGRGSFADGSKGNWSGDGGKGRGGRGFGKGR